jgi:hypothetical protein
MSKNCPQCTSIGNMNKGRELQAAIEYSDGEYVQKDVNDINDGRSLYTEKKKTKSIDY